MTKTQEKQRTTAWEQIKSTLKKRGYRMGLRHKEVDNFEHTYNTSNNQLLATAVTVIKTSCPVTPRTQTQPLSADEHADLIHKTERILEHTANINGKRIIIYPKDLADLKEASKCEKLCIFHDIPLNAKYMYNILRIISDIQTKDGVPLATIYAKKRETETLIHYDTIYILAKYGEAVLATIGIDKKEQTRNGK